MKFGPNFLFGIKWDGEDYPYIVMTPLVKPSVVIDRIRASPRVIGNALLHLLNHKRSLSDPEIIESIDAKVKVKNILPTKTAEYEKELRDILVKLRALEKESKYIVEDNINTLQKFERITPPPKI
jgi:hypothetical protein